MTLENKLPALIFFGGFLTLLYFAHEPRWNFEKTKLQAARYADANKDGIVSESEWIGMYKTLEIPYDSRNPHKLSKKDFLRYISIKSNDSH